jgi:hypothetical protein
MHLMNEEENNLEIEEDIKEENNLPEEELTFNDEGSLVPRFQANRFQEDPRQDLFWNYYMEGILNKQPSIRKAGIKAGYSEASSGRISQTLWFKNKKKALKKGSMYRNAVQNLDDVMKIKYIGTKFNKETGEDEEEINIDRAKLVIDVSKAVVKSLGKDDGWSERSEVTGKDGSPLVIIPSELMEAFDLGDGK